MRSENRMTCKKHHRFHTSAAACLYTLSHVVRHMINSWSTTLLRDRGHPLCPLCISDWYSSIMYQTAWLESHSCTPAQVHYPLSFLHSSFFHLLVGGHTLTFSVTPLISSSTVMILSDTYLHQTILSSPPFHFLSTPW